MIEIAIASMFSNFASHLASPRMPTESHTNKRVKALEKK